MALDGSGNPVEGATVSGTFASNHYNEPGSGVTGADGSSDLVVDARGVVKSFGRTRALTGLDLQVEWLDGTLGHFEVINATPGTNQRRMPRSCRVSSLVLMAGRDSSLRTRISSSPWCKSLSERW